MKIIHREKGLAIAETPPQIRTIKVIEPGNNWGGINLKRPISKRIFRLGFPYMQFYLKDSFDDPDYDPDDEDYDPNLRLTFSKKPVQSIEKDEVCFPFLPNVYTSDLAICLSVPSNIEGAIEEFWTSSFYVWYSWYGCWMVPDAIKKPAPIAIDSYVVGALGGMTAGDVEAFSVASLAQFEAWEKGTKKEGVHFISNLEWPQMFTNLPDLWKKDKDFHSVIDDELAFKMTTYFG